MSNLQKYVVVFGTLCYFVTAEPPVQGIKTTNVLGSSGQHTSFNFIRPGLTQTSFAFSGPSSHQSFSSSIGNPQLAQRVLPNLAHALAYHNSDLGHYPIRQYSIPNDYNDATASGPALAYQTSVDPVSMLTYAQQLQQQQAYIHSYQPKTVSQAQLAQLLAFKQAQTQVQQQQLQTVEPQLVPEQIQLQQKLEPQSEKLSQNLLGVAYSSAPSVAYVKVSGNGYKFDF